MHKLRPLETIQKILISTPSELAGEFESERLLVAHAWRNSSDNWSKSANTKNPLSRNAFIVAFETNSCEKAVGHVLPDYTNVGDEICIYLSILYGKRFDNHGLVEENGLFRIPNYTLFKSVHQTNLPQNSHTARRNLSIPLNLVEVCKIEKLLYLKSDLNFKRVLLAAGSFYLQALQNFEERPEIAYLNLITAGEVISNYNDYNKDELLDEQVIKIINEISKASDNGPELARKIKGRLFQVKSKFLRALSDLLTDPFFSIGDANQDFLCLKKTDIKSRLSAAYDLRSQYVHTGISFGKWISGMQSDQVCEVQSGMPVVGDKKFAEALSKAPTYFGLERIIRYCLLRFIHREGFDIDPSLDNNKIETYITTEIK